MKMIALPNGKSITLHMGAGDGTFSSPVQYISYATYGVVAGDLDNNGFPDLISDSDVQNMTIYYNSGFYGR
jgi:hypothetical protein